MGRLNPCKVRSARATGNLVVVEMLDAKTALQTNLTLGLNTEAPPQGYIVDIGPMVETDKYGFKVGDRVLLQGKYVPIPLVKGVNDRELGVVMPHDIKCVLEENDE